MATRKVKRFNDGGDAAGYGYGEGAGAAQGAGVGGFGSPGEGYGDSDNSNLTSRRVMAGDTMSRFSSAPTNAPVGYFGRTTIAPEAETAPVSAPTNAPPGYFGRVTIAPEAETAPVGRYGRTTIASDTTPEEAASHRASMQAIADGVTAQGNRNAGGAYQGEGNDRAKGGMIKKYAKGGSVSSASSRGDGIAQRGKTKGRMC